MYQRFLNDFEANNQRVVRAEKWVKLFEQVPGITTEIFLIFILLGCLLVMSWAQSANSMQEMGLLVAAFFRLIPTLNRVSTTLTMINSAREPMTNLLAVAGELEDLKPVIRLTAGVGAPVDLSRGSISFKQVSFSYYDGAPPVLRDVDLEIPRGQMTVLIGGSGGGK